MFYYKNHKLVSIIKWVVSNPHQKLGYTNVWLIIELSVKINTQTL